MTRNDRAQHYKGNMLEVSVRIVWNENEPNGNKGNEKKSIDNKRAFVGKVEGTNNQKGKGLLEQYGIMSIGICG